MSVELMVRDGVGVITIRRPLAMNALDTASKLELQGHWREVEDRADVRVAILTGEGTRAFCVGSDLKEQNPDSAGPQSATVAALFGTGEDPNPVRGFPERTPVIAAINGYALGGGLELALACDIRLASTTARFGLPEVKLGSMPGAGGTVRLFQAVGRSDAMRLLLTGEPIDAVEAHRIGLVSMLHDPDDLMESAWRLARRIADNAPLSVGAVKLMSQGLSGPLHGALAMERMAWALLSSSADRAEGRAAFRESRSPVYVGH